MPTHQPPTPWKLRPSIAEREGKLVQTRRNLHRIPELGFQEHTTSAYIQSELKRMGVPFTAGWAGTGLKALVVGKRPGPVVALRTDMDGLPVHEENTCEYVSQHPGQMHACGHDAHMAIALGTLAHLHERRDQLAGTVVVIFQPAEEGPGGAKPMVEAGVLESPSVDAIFGLHVWTPLPLGTVGVKPGPLMAQTEEFEATFVGRGGHGGMPHQTVDALVVAAHAVVATQTLISRNQDPLEAGVVTIGTIQAGTKHNVIAERARITGTVRHYTPEKKDMFPATLTRIFKGVADAHGAQVEFHWNPKYPAVINHPAQAELVKSVALKAAPHALCVTDQCLTMGGEDMSYFLQARPGCYFFLGASNPEIGCDKPHHHPRFNVDERVLGMGVEMMVGIVEKHNGCQLD